MNAFVDDSCKVRSSRTAQSKVGNRTDSGGSSIKHVIVLLLRSESLVLETQTSLQLVISSALMSASHQSVKL